MHRFPLGESGESEGYLPVFQRNIAGSHQCKGSEDCVETSFGDQGWKRKPRDPQMPLANNLSCVHSQQCKTQPCSEDTAATKRRKWISVLSKYG
jgi:hypothetical protein